MQYLFGPNSIFYPPYLLSALVLTVIWLRFSQKQSLRNSIQILFSKKSWFNDSTWLDVKLCILNLLFLGFAFHEIENKCFDYSLKFSTKSLSGVLGINPLPLKMSTAAEALLVTLFTMLAIDFAAYWVHRWMHSSNKLWRIHAVHHSAKNLTPLTTYRQHPFEVILLNSARMIAAGFALALFHYAFPNQTPVITIAGLGAGFFIYMFTVNLHHSTVPVHYPKFLQHIFLSPHIHQIHHSYDKEHHDKNFGVVFSFWDKFFGTYHSENVKLHQLRFGLNKEVL